MKTFSALLGATILAAVAVSPAQALTFNFSNTAAGGAEAGTTARRGFEIAAGYWSSIFTDNVTINLQIGYSQLAATTIAQAGSNRALLGMSAFYSALGADSKTAVDARAVANLPTLSTSAITVAGGINPGAVTATTNAFANGVNGNAGYTDLATRIDNDRGVNNSTLAITKASAKSLGLTTDVNGTAINYNTLDATLTFNSLLAFDFNPNNGIAAGTFDFIGVAIHEIGHALGFTSGVDSYDSKTSPGQTNAASRTSNEGFVVMNSLDLFRYSSLNVLDWSTQNTPYFSLDKGATQLFGDSRFSTGVLNGDGRQASHFKDSPSGAPQLGILDPTSGRGQMQEVTALDVAAFDAIDWDVNFDALSNPRYRKTTQAIWRAANGLGGAVPEPAMWLQMIAGFGFVGAAFRRLRRRGGKFAAA